MCSLLPLLPQLSCLHSWSRTGPCLWQGQFPGRLSADTSCPIHLSASQRGEESLTFPVSEPKTNQVLAGGCIVLRGPFEVKLDTIKNWHHSPPGLLKFLEVFRAHLSLDLPPPPSRQQPPEVLTVAVTRGQAEGLRSWRLWGVTRPRELVLCVTGPAGGTDHRVHKGAPVLPAQRCFSHSVHRELQGAREGGAVMGRHLHDPSLRYKK